MNDPNFSSSGLEDDLKKMNQELMKKYQETIEGWAIALEIRGAEGEDPTADEED